MKFLVTIFIVGLALAGFIYYKNQLRAEKAPHPLQSVKGLEIVVSPDPNQNNSNAIYQIQQQVKNINLNQLASSSPQIQQVINEIQALPQTPINNAKNACVQICNKL